MALSKTLQRRNHETGGGGGRGNGNRFFKYRISLFGRSEVDLPFILCIALLALHVYY